jgi:ABC-type transporter Mla subunit MlaD
VPSKSLSEWLAEGEQLFAESMTEFHELESQLADLEQRLSAKHAEVNRLAQIIGKPAVEGRKVVTAQLVDNSTTQAIPNSPATIARALQGRGLGR